MLHALFEDTPPQFGILIPKRLAKRAVDRNTLKRLIRHEAVKIHGAWKGAALSLGRICRCNPWNAGGLDPVPETRRTSRDS